MNKQAPSRLYQFWFSHFNEKARWILDYKGVTYERVTFAPGMHFKPMRAVSGQTSTPVLIDGQSNKVVAGATAIGEFVDRAYPERPLLPAPPDERAEALQECAWFDERIGGDHRRALFHFLFEHDRGAVGALFAIQQARAKRWFYAAAMPVMCPMLRKLDDINAGSAARGEAALSAALERIVKRTSATGYLCGDRFSLADLTAAALLFPLVLPEQLSFAIPERARPALEAWRDRWQEKPGTEWVRRIFREYR